MALSYVHAYIRRSGLSEGVHARMPDRLWFSKLDYNLSEAGTRELLTFLKGVCT